MRKRRRYSETFQKSLAAGMCAALIGTVTACGSGAGSTPPVQEESAAQEPAVEMTGEQEPAAETTGEQESAVETSAEKVSAEEIPVEEILQPPREEEGEQDAAVSQLPAKQEAAAGETQKQEDAQENVKQNPGTQDKLPRLESAQLASGGAGQISMEEAKAAALADAGVSGEVIYTKEKLDYEHGISVYEIEFFADNVEYEYEINAETGEVYGKSVETHRGQGHQQAAGNSASQTYIDTDSAVAVALDHAGVSDRDVSRLKTEFDIDDGRAEYEVEFDYGGREYEYKISAVDGLVLEYEIE